MVKNKGEGIDTGQLHKNCRHKNNVQQYEISIEKGKSEKYAICAYLHKAGDSVELFE